MDKDIQREIRKIIDEIEEKSGDGDYIYRGEPKIHEEHPHYGKVSSSLWREIVKELLKKPVDMGIINTEFVQRGMLSSVKNYANETTGEDGFEIMGQLQHYGGKTNLIDFTTDYLRALFFVCDGTPQEDGRVILLRRNEEIDKKYHIGKPLTPINRVIAQKSIFVQPPKGYIEPQDICCIITIPQDLKPRILQHLRKYHDISTETIYNDLHGFIKHQRIHQGAYIDYYIGLSHQFRREFDSAIENFNNAIERNPHFPEAYYYRGAAHLNIGAACQNVKKYNCAIEDLDKAIQLKSNYEEAYNVRGLVYHHKSEYGCAIADFDKAIEINSEYADAYNNRGASYREKGENSLAIEDCTRALQLNPEYGDAYYNCGIARLHLSEWKEASTDLETAKTKGTDIIKIFCDNYQSVADFQKKYSTQLPPNIAKMLTST